MLSYPPGRYLGRGGVGTLGYPLPPGPDLDGGGGRYLAVGTPSSVNRLKTLPSPILRMRSVKIGVFHNVPDDVTSVVLTAICAILIFCSPLFLNYTKLAMLSTKAHMGKSKIYSANKFQLR